MIQVTSCQLSDLKFDMKIKRYIFDLLKSLHDGETIRIEDRNSSFDDTTEFLDYLTINHYLEEDERKDVEDEYGTEE